MSDLVPGEVLEPVSFELTTFIVREYCHGVEEESEVFHSDTDGTRQMAPPTFLQVAQSRLVRANCPLRSGTKVVMHYEFDAEWFGPLYAGDMLFVEGVVEDVYEKRNRMYCQMRTTITRQPTKECVGIYRQTTLLSVEPNALDEGDLV